MQDHKIDTKTIAMNPIVVGTGFTIYAETKQCGGVFLHTSPILNWSKSTYLELLDVLSLICDNLSKKGIDVVYTLIPASDTKLWKFSNMMGFEDRFVIHNNDGEDEVLLSHPTEPQTCHL